ncbi:methyltransferase domain-containing protein [Jannaschia sp. M317]|uniref:methyltransferase domain-containing protein n=1 Tax=Jannaschia sp. M317 TaxID=2867011 RepID=UPI0021A26D3D|nr:methyltransferase domain-containing protein [Jannaschia sp. M317]UWQ16268.1 methyltransferase domain-containing protein [Jannaschia sp. M317]
MLTFDADTARLLDTAYQGADMTRRRRASFDALTPLPGETLLDIGCGSGLLAEELARAVGTEGRIIGIDPSDDMRSLARARNADTPQIEILAGRADALPVPDGVADGAVSVQVFEYLDDLDAAVADALRCIRPGGRLVIADLHFGTFSWHSDDHERMSRVRSAWDGHFTCGEVPALLPGLIRAQGHEVTSQVPVPFVDHRLKPDGLAMTMLHLMRAFAVSSGEVPEKVAQAWFDEQFALDRDGRFFFTITQVVTVARKREA